MVTGVNKNWACHPTTSRNLVQTNEELYDRKLIWAPKITQVWKGVPLPNHHLETPSWVFGSVAKFSTIHQPSHARWKSRRARCHLGISDIPEIWTNGTWNPWFTSLLKPHHPFFKRPFSGSILTLEGICIYIYIWKNICVWIYIQECLYKICRTPLTILLVMTDPSRTHCKISNLIVSSQEMERKKNVLFALRKARQIMLWGFLHHFCYQLKKNIFQAPKSFRMKKDQRKKSNNIIQLPPQKKNFEILSPNSYTPGKSHHGFSEKKQRGWNFRFFPFRIGPPFFGEHSVSFRQQVSFQTRRRPGHSDAPGREGWLAFLQPRNFGEKIPMGEMWVEKVNIDIADIHIWLHIYMRLIPKYHSYWM